MSVCCDDSDKGTASITSARSKSCLLLR